ncbi:MAG TPA: 2Fe-2S iron-sulfur cluster-binding protein [Acidimicrobiia bacterium]|nr:2Fe-2S iron-sulfur cluster-binding protein [Acidimicrobiia bacterium]
MSSHRLDHQPGEVIDRSRAITFDWNGYPYQGYAGDTIASAVAAHGERVFSRSYKYHRPRGILTATYHDPNLMVQVGDDPNVRAAHRLIEEGMVVEPQNAWPSLDFDVKAANRLVGRFLSPGFYYKTFMAPRPLWPAYQKVLSRFANGGRVDPQTEPGRFDHRHAHPDVLVAGGGPAGMAAAIGAAEAGASVILVEEERSLGGHLRYGGSEDLTTLADLAAQVESNPGIEVMTDSVVTGRFDHNWVSVVQRSVPGVSERLVKARVKCLVVAVGTLERPYVFEGNDLPGVMLSTAVRRLINLHGVRPGERAVVLTANSSGDAAVGDLERVGVEIASVIDAREGGSVHTADGSKGVTSVLDWKGRRTEADLLVTATGWTSPTALLNMAGDRPVYVPNAARYVPNELPEEVLATGGIVGDGATDHLIAHGIATGAEAARRALMVRAFWQNAAPAGIRTDIPRVEPVGIPDLGHDLHPEMFRSSTHGIVDFSEDVTSKDLISAAKEGYDSMELVKRYTTVGMGPVQGKVEAVNAVAIHGEAVAASLLETTTTTWRPPYAPVRLGTLAGRKYEPVRYSTIQPWHEANDAVPLVAGQWIRPEHYGDPAAEVRAVRNDVGIIDVSPIGKIDLRGQDVPRLLELVYVNKWSKLDVGKVRYGIMCAEDGVILDDGVTGRLSEDHYMMSTTSGGAGTVWNWLDEWLQTAHPDWDVKPTAVTDGYASINVAGPRSRELVSRLTDIDLDPGAFPYMEVRTGTVAGVDDCFVWRIGFTGELSFEIHIPSSQGLDVWEALIAEGEDLGVRPFGVEAQRILRLEKGHFIVGQDTDGLSQGFGFGVDRAIRLDKADFAGKPELAWQAERGDYPHLVAIHTDDPELVPLEASQIVDPDGTIRGRITSARMSPTLGRSICLGQVDAVLDVADRRIEIQLPNRKRAPARVLATHAHFDPEGTRARG